MTNSNGTRRPASASLGETYGRLTVISVGRTVRSDDTVADCSCGGRWIGRLADLRQDATQSCGCLQNESRTSHGESRTPLYRAWVKMHTRCRHELSYVNKRITVCDEWSDYATFRDWALANGWQPGVHLDRIDGNGGYSPVNCQVLSAIEHYVKTGLDLQGGKASLAKLTNEQVIEIRRRYAAGGVTQVALAAEYGVHPSTISDIVLRKTWAHL